MAKVRAVMNYGMINADTIDARVILTDKSPPLYMFESTNKHFTGRDDKIQEIEKAIEERNDEKDSLCRTIVLEGFGGMGKSETVKAFAQKIHKIYGYIAWIDAQSKENVEASFRKLAQKMKTEFSSLEDIPKIQETLANLYEKGLFIFDNAEKLQTGDGQLGIEDFLYKGFLKNKPIFLATSRNGSGLWGGMNSQIKFINIDCLAKEDATTMLKNYLLIQKGTVIPASLESSISLLVDTLGGYPLGLSIVGSTIAERAEQISFDEIESRIQAYTEMLKDISVQDISAELKYETALELIFNEATKKMKARANGDHAIELLNIIAWLHPNQIFAGVVNAIDKGTPCENHWTRYTDVETHNLDIMEGLKMLSDYSIASPPLPGL